MVEEAFDKATHVGTEAEHTYENEFGQRVRWVLVGVQDVEELLTRTIRDGTEIKSEIMDTADPTALVATKAELVRHKN